ncbi:cytoplasmic dynein 1 intermediate chain 2-like isoform X1 [Pristis pectinata]|uniref:cytoplasmic dynein 1 intermediate chain 2-like isoform X1 n=2 Tax=Pristis pectinata TaxID=685728 RepID=UPI00223E6086|nr:cytoplasmic dynein 1 intermediate chain 2-like isoform X1 [Pristis pectinata]
MADKSELKAELERKKLRLAQIREEKKRKEEEKKKKDGDFKKETPSSQVELDLERKRKETEALLQSIGITTEPSIVQPLRTVTGDTCLFNYLVHSPISPSNKSLGTPSESESQESVEGTVGARTLQWDTDLSVLQLQTDSEMRHHLQKLGIARITHVDIAPCERLAHCKETQTPVAAKPDEEKQETVVPVTAITEAETETPEETQEEREEGHQVNRHDLTEDEKEKILQSDAFRSFFDQTSRVIEQALTEQVDIFFDYSGRNLDDKEGEVQAGAKLSLNRQFYDENWSKDRVVTCLDWSQQYPELLVASYTNNEDALNEPDGVALIWNMKFKKTTPEYIFHCQSKVMSACFAQFHPNLMVGGTYSGQIVLWDNRSNKKTPVQRTPLSAAAHTHPVYCVNVVGTQNAHNLVSVSTDGKLCTWSLDMLSQPQDSIELVHKQSKAVAVTSMSFPLGDINNFVVGSEEGSVYTACRLGSKAGIIEMFEGHQGPVTGIHCHTAAGAVDFSHLFITSSFDWTVKLWSTKNNKSLYSFEDSSDYVFDVMWSPIHPALFACVDGMGRLDLWNLNEDSEVPTASVTMEGNPALHRVRWAQSGREIAVGDSEGQVLIYDVGEQIAVPRNDEWNSFAQTLVDLKANGNEAEEEATTGLLA